LNKIADKIRKKCGVIPTEYMTATVEIRARINYLKDTLIKANKNTYVLGISGGVDSTVAGKLCAMACEELQKENYNAYFIAVRLPYGEQFAEADAQVALDFIGPHDIQNINIKSATDAMHDIVVDNIVNTSVIFAHNTSYDFH